MRVRECARHLSAYSRASIHELSRTQVFNRPANSRKREKERKRSLCASLRMKRSTGPSRPVTKTTHTRSSARYSRCPAPLTLSVASRSGRRGVKMGKQPTVRYELPELRIHRSVSPVDCLCNGTCRVKPCAERHRRSCHRGARTVPTGALRALGAL